MDKLKNILFFLPKKENCKNNLSKKLTLFSEFSDYSEYSDYSDYSENKKAPKN